MKNFQQGGQEQSGNQEQQVIEQIVNIFQQLSPEFQQQLLQTLSQIMQTQAAPTQQEIMKMGGIRSQTNNQSQMYR